MPGESHQTLKEDEESEGIEEDGNLRSKGNIMRMQIFDEIRGQSLDYTAVRESRNTSSCEGRWVYVYDLPSEFNVDLAALCDSLFPAFNLCDFFEDSGIGKPVNTRENGSQIFVPPDRWFNTHQYALELISHARVIRYKCRTLDPERASLFYIPFYGGQSVMPYPFPVFHAFMFSCLQKFMVHVHMFLSFQFSCYMFPGFHLFRFLDTR